MPLRSPKRDLSLYLFLVFLVRKSVYEKSNVVLKINTLNQNRDYRRIYNRGKSIVTPGVVIYISKNRNKNVRIGITATKKIGKAVQRNRARRVIKEAVRDIFPLIKNGYDLVLVARGKTVYLKSTHIKSLLLKNLKSTGVLHENSFNKID